MLAVFLDKNRVYPKWFDYLNLCNALTEVVVAPAWLFLDGAFAWEGAITWWINMVVLFPATHRHECDLLAYGRFSMGNDFRSALCDEVMQ